MKICIVYGRTWMSNCDFLVSIWPVLRVDRDTLCKTLFLVFPHMDALRHSIFGVSTLHITLGYGWHFSSPPHPNHVSFQHPHGLFLFPRRVA